LDVGSHEDEDGDFGLPLAFDLGWTPFARGVSVKVSDHRRRALRMGESLFPPLGTGPDENSKPFMYVPSDKVRHDRIYQGDVFEEFACLWLPSADLTFLREDEDGAKTYGEDDLPGGWQEEEVLVVRAKRWRVVILSHLATYMRSARRTSGWRSARNTTALLSSMPP
jgi:hypothetical protein